MSYIKQNEGVINTKKPVTQTKSTSKKTILHFYCILDCTFGFFFIHLHLKKEMNDETRYNDSAYIFCRRR